MLKFLLKTFYYETTTYTIRSSKDEVVKKLDALFTERKGLMSSPNLTGEFVGFPDGFIMTPKWSVAVFRGFERDPAYLKGVITEVDDHTTSVEVSVKANSVFAIFFILILIFTLVNVSRYIFYRGSTHSVPGLILPVLIGIPMLIAFARGVSTSLRSNFEEFMGV